MNQRLPVRKTLRRVFGAENYRILRTGEIHVYTEGVWRVLGSLLDPKTLDLIRSLA